MADNKSHVKQTPSKDGIALVVGALFILSLVFAAYNYFNRNNDKTVTVVDDNQNVVTKTKPTGTVGDKAAVDTKTAQAKQQATTAEKQNATVTTTTPASTGAWVANNYKPGDIKGGSYTVVKGDTLWEIAEAAYGDGRMWTKIRDANLDQIQTLPNGTKALIKPGQKLVLP